MGVWNNIDVELLKKYGFKPTKEMQSKFKTMSVRQSAEYIRDTLSLAISPEQIIYEIALLGHEKYKNDVQLKPFVREYLHKLRDTGVKMCIATASVKSNINVALERLGVLDFFEFIITADELKTGKDNPEIFLKCAEKFGLPKEEIAVFEDALHAIKTAKSAGFYVVGVYDEYSADETELIKKYSDEYIESFEALI